jgi:glutamate-1-semialdehyde 2,1-aminomutase
MDISNGRGREVQLAPGYRGLTRASEKMYRRALKVFAGGVNHNARYYDPYPLFLRRGRGRHVWDQDGNRYVDYWMGHMALILGHSPRPVVDALRLQAADGTLLGMGSELSVDLGEEIQKTVPSAEKLRFCNTGAEATMYLVRLARGFTRRRKVIKMEGGWHGYNTELNKSVRAPFGRPEGAGILPGEQEHVESVRFNDLEAAEEAVKRAHGDVAVIFLEPVLGAGGCIPAEPDYLKGLRELADRHSTLLAFDEIITGFRLALGGAQERYGVTPDLTTLGKIVGGGLPIGVVCGKKEVLEMADPRRKDDFVSIGGGTFSENPLTMTAGLATVRFLRRNRAGLYRGLEGLGADLRAGLDEVFGENGLEAYTTGMGSLFLTHFGKAPRQARPPTPGEKDLGGAYARHLMTKGVFLLPGHAGGISTEHTPADVSEMVARSGEFAAARRGRPG